MMVQDPTFDAPRPPSFPPLFQGREVTGATDPFAKACSLATLGCDAGTLVFNITPDMWRAAIVFAPAETPLEQAMPVFCACGVGFQNALGALAPPEVAVHLQWQGDILVNGATAGRIRAAASTDDPAAKPDWLVVGIELCLIPQSDDAPGNTPHQTTLYEEGCSQVSPIELLEGWSRHTLLWVNRIIDNEIAALHTDWRGLAHGIGEEISMPLDGKTIDGTFLGVDEHFGMLIRSAETTRTIPLSSILETGGDT